MFRANKMTTKTSFKTVTETVNFENGPLASVSLKTAIAEAGLRAMESVAINDPIAHVRQYCAYLNDDDEEFNSFLSSLFMSSKNCTRSLTLPTVNAPNTANHVNKAMHVVQTMIFFASPLKSLALNSAPAETPMTERHAVSASHNESRTTDGVNTFRNYYFLTRRRRRRKKERKKERRGMRFSSVGCWCAERVVVIARSEDKQKNERRQQQQQQQQQQHDRTTLRTDALDSIPTNM